MTSPAPMPGPPCDICGEAPSVLSILNYADWQQLKLCGGDAPAVMRGIADTMDGGQPAAPEPAAEPSPGVTPATAEQAAHDAVIMAGDDDDEPGSKADHWASTANVRRSTHGHRTPRKAAGTPRKDEPE